MEKRKDELKKDLLAVHKKLGRTFTRKDYDAYGKWSSRTVERVYGSWTEAMEESGLAALAMKEPSPAQIVDDDWNRKKQELVQKAEKKKVDEIRTYINKVDLVRAMIDTAAAQLDPPMIKVQPIKVAKLPNNNRQKTLPWFEFSDLQLGTMMTKEAMGGLNKHDWGVWQEKLDVWKRQVIAKLIEAQYIYDVQDVVLNCGGDMVEGIDIFRGQRWHIDQHVVNQALMGATDTAAAFIEIIRTFPNITFHITEVFGNHGRIGMKGELPHSCSMDKVYQRFLQKHIENSGLTNIHYYENEAWFYLLQIGGWNHLILHGDQGMPSLWSNRPTVNGLEKLVCRYNQMLQCQIHFVHSGHFHNDWSLAFNLCYLLINGCWPGTSNFSASQMVASSPPMQCVHYFDTRVGLARTDRIYLTEEEVRRPIEPNVLRGRK